MKKSREQTWLAVIIVGYLALALAYSVINPAFESPDEIYHYAYVDYLLREWRLPVAELGGPESEYHQPPLYYLLAAAVAAPVRETQNPDAAIQRNPFWGWRIGQVGVDNKNQFVHGRAEAFPYRDWVLRLHLVRWLSVVLQVPTILATCLIGREVFPGRSALRLGALAFVAFLPQFLFVSGSASNDNLIVPLTALVTWLLVRSVRQGLSWRRSLVSGVLIGLAVTTKMSGLALLPTALIVVTWIGARDGAWKRTAAAWGMVLSLTALLAGPVLARNVQLYGEPTALQRMSATWGQHDPPLSYTEALRQAPNVWTSFWARFGYGQIPIPNSIYLALLALVGLSVIGLGLWLIRERRKLASVTRWQLLLLAAVGGVFAFLVLNYVRVSLTGGNGRFAFPALPAYGLLLFLGLSAWLPEGWHGRLAVVAHGGMAVFAFVCLVCYLRPAYALPPLQSEKPVVQYPVEWQFGDEIVLLGYKVERDTVYPGDDAMVTLYWQALKAPAADYTVFIHLIGPRGELVGARDTYPALGRLPTTLWQADAVLADAVSVPVRIEAAAVAPAALHVEVGLYDYPTRARLSIVDRVGRPVETPIVGRIKLALRVWPAVTPAMPSRYDFGGEIALVGYDLSPTAQPGEILAFTLYWQALARPAHDYTVFVHVLDAAGQTVAQADAPPVAGTYPTGLWAASETLADRRHLLLPAGLAPGEYRVRIGLYDPASGQRLPVLGESGNPTGDSITLPALRVQRQDG
jgi:4-amino-4-deoxy-L-arabinose transferase-like glycosyltransferase